MGRKVEVSGRVRVRYDHPDAQPGSSLHAARQLGLEDASEPRASGLLRADLKLTAGAFGASATFSRSKEEGAAATGKAQLNELHASGSALGWYYTAGRKIVSWDVGWGFRPNDLIQQEARLVLTDTVLQGRPLLMVEKFDDDAAYSLVAVNPTKDKKSFGGDEPALAGRYFRHVGSADLYGFVRWGARTGDTFGAALSWVATDSMEWHVSWNSSKRLDTLCVGQASGLVAAAPSANCTVGRTQRALLGNTWSSPDSLTVITEWWWDGGAPSPRTWRDWNARNVALSQLAGQVPAADRLAVAANMAWQSNALLQTNLHRSNVLLSFSWPYRGYAFSAYQLWHPADGGRIYTATVGWSRAGWEVNAGARRYGGPRDSITAQLPTKLQVYVGGSYQF